MSIRPGQAVVKNVLAGDKQVGKIIAGTGSGATEVWTNNKYPQSLEFGPLPLSGSSGTQYIAEHVVAEDGWLSISFWAYAPPSSAYSYSLIISTPQGTFSSGSTGNTNTGYTLKHEGFYKKGQTVSFGVYHLGSIPAVRGKWEIEKTEVRLPWDSAKGGPLRVAFVGTSITEGTGLPRYDSYVNWLASRMLRNVPGANAANILKQKSGTLPPPSRSGFYFLNAGSSGSNSSTYLSSAISSMVYGWNPHIIFHEVGTNDYAAQTPLDTFKTNLRDRINEFSPSTLHVFVHAYRRETRTDTGITWAQYGAALEEFVQENPQTIFVDVSQEWQSKKALGVSYLQANNVNPTQEGAQLLAECVADALELNMRVGTRIWGINVADGRSSNNNLVPTSNSIIQSPGRASSTDNSVVVLTESGQRVLTWNNNGVRYADVYFGASAFAFPIVAIFAVHSYNKAGQTFVQPFFDAANTLSEGRWSAWRDRDSDEYRAAMNSGLVARRAKVSNTAGMDVLAFHMLPNGRVRIYVNSYSPVAELPVESDKIDETLGPWMKSLRLGASRDMAFYTAMRTGDIYFEHAGTDNAYVSGRVRDVARKYNITKLVGGISTSKVVDPMNDMTYWTKISGSSEFLADGMTAPGITGEWRGTRKLAAKFRIDYVIGDLPSGSATVRLGSANSALSMGGFVNFGKGTYTTVGESVTPRVGTVLSQEWDGVNGNYYLDGNLVTNSEGVPLTFSDPARGGTMYPYISPQGTGAPRITEVVIHTLS